MDKIQELKKQAAQAAVSYITSNSIIGLGTGSTAAFAVRLIAAKLRSGELTKVIGIPSSKATEEQAIAEGVPLWNFEQLVNSPANGRIDITIDGADEVDPQLNLIKGGGGALLREKVLAQASAINIIIVDEGKLSPCLGTRWAVPVEVVPFAAPAEKHFLESLGAKVLLRHKAAKISQTDQGNYILDADFGEIDDPAALAGKLNERAGIAEHGLFIGTTKRVIVAGEDGIRTMERQ